MIDSQTFPLCPPHAKLERTHGIRLDFGGCVQCRLNELAQLREKLAAAEEERDMWLRIAQRLFKERQTMLHGHVYDLPTDDVILEATILEAVIDGTEANETT